MRLVSGCGGELGDIGDIGDSSACGDGDLGELFCGLRDRDGDDRQVSSMNLCLFCGCGDCDL